MQPDASPIPAFADQDRVIPHRRVRERRGRSHGRIQLNLTSMIDVTFLLLIYFMVATDFKLGEEIYQLDLPDRSQGAQADPFQLDDEPLRIIVNTTGDHDEAYIVRIDGPYDQPQSFEGLYEFLYQRNTRINRSGGLFQPDHPVIIHPTRMCRWDHTIEAFNAVVRADYRNVTLGRPR